jgi:integrase
VSWVRKCRYLYSVPGVEAAAFVVGNDCVRDFLCRYEADGGTYYEKSMGLVRFFQWLKVVKGLELSPSEFLNLHLKKRKTDNIEERRWALKLALEYSRDNPDLKGKAKNYAYTAFYLPVKMFCDYHEAPLTTSNGFFPKRSRRKYSEKPFTVEAVCKILSVLSQRDRAVCMTELQSGQSIKQVLVDINRQCKYLFREIDQGKQRIRLDFAERKGNGFNYFSYISQDTIQEIQKWRSIRERILQGLGVKSEYLFITESGKPLTRKLFHNNFRLTLTRHKLYTGPLSIRSHGFRKFFEQEASPPERGISKSYISFMMGHSSGDGSDHKLDVVGGVYDNCPHTYPSVVEKEYEKLEPYINIYTGKTSVGNQGLDLNNEEAATLKQFLAGLRNGRIKMSPTTDTECALPQPEQKIRLVFGDDEEKESEAFLANLKVGKVKIVPTNKKREG